MIRASMGTAVLIFLTSTVATAAPHFFIQMENQSAKETLLRFQPVTGNVSLEPALADATPLAPASQSARYGVVFNPLGRDDTFNVVFTGQQDCAFHVAFYAPNNPKITVSGPGCFGGGYKVVGDTLRLYVSDIHLSMSGLIQ